MTTPEYQPEKIKFRERQLEQLEAVFSAPLENLYPTHLFIWGRSDTGKTMCIQRCIDEFKEKVKKLSKNVRVSYVNCKDAYSAKDIEKKINLAEGNGKETLLDFLQAIKGKYEYYIVVLDEIDKVQARSRFLLDRIVYLLVRANTWEGHIGDSSPSFILVLIANDYNFRGRLDMGTQHSLGVATLEFPPYSPTELHEILEDMVHYKIRESGGKNEEIDEAVMKKLMEICSAYGLRSTIGIFNNVINSARTGNGTISVAHLAQQERQTCDTEKTKILHLDVHKKLLLKIVTWLDYKNEDFNMPCGANIVRNYRIEIAKIGLHGKSQAWVYAALEELESEDLIGSYTPTDAHGNVRAYAVTKKLLMFFDAIFEKLYGELKIEIEDGKNIKRELQKKLLKFTMGHNLTCPPGERLTYGEL